MTQRPERDVVSGHYAGPVTRLLAYVLDSAISFLLFTFMIAGSVFVISLVTRVDLDVQERESFGWLAGLAFWLFLYNWAGLSVAGRTPGKAIVGLRVVGRRGLPLGSGAAFIRVISLPLSFIFFGLGFVGIVVGKERRALHDRLAKSAVVYDWGDRPAELPAPLTRWLARRLDAESGPTL